MDPIEYYSDEDDDLRLDESLEQTIAVRDFLQRGGESIISELVIFLEYNVHVHVKRGKYRDIHACQTAKDYI